MKTKDLIAMLKKEDPSGEEHVCVNNVDIRFASNNPAYYDGPQQVIQYNEKGKVIGGKYHRSGRKIQIYLGGFTDMIWDRQEDFKVDYSELDEERQKSYKENHEKIIQAAKDCDLEIELEYFTKYIVERASKILDECDAPRIAKEFYAQNMNPYIPIPDDIPIIGESHISRKMKQWDREIEVCVEDDELVIRRNVK